MRVLVIGISSLLALAACESDSEDDGPLGFGGGGDSAVCPSPLACGADPFRAVELSRTSADLAGKLRRRVAAIDASCSALGSALGLSEEAINRGGCLAVTDALDAERAGAPSSRVNSVQCGSTLAQIGACDGGCACSCDPRAACAFGESFGTCTGLCEACAARSSDEVVSCSGSCAGSCTGDCDDVAIDGGVCDGQCVGTCAGVCTQPSGEGVTCEGECLGGCDVEIEDARCRVWAPAGACACGTRCDRTVQADATCSRLGLFDPVVEPAVAEAERTMLQACAEARALDFARLIELVESDLTALSDDREVLACLRESAASTDDVEANLSYIDVVCVALDEVVGG